MSFYSKGYKLAVDFCMNFSQKILKKKTLFCGFYIFPLTIQQFSEGSICLKLFLSKFFLVHFFITLKVVFMVWFCFFCTKQSAALCRTAAVMLGFQSEPLSRE